MAHDLFPLERVAAALLATYLLHSSILLGGAWLLLRLGRVQSHWLMERTWKLAAAAGLITTPCAVLCGFSQPLHRFALDGRGAEPAEVAVALRSEAPIAAPKVRNDVPPEVTPLVVRVEQAPTTDDLPSNFPYGDLQIVGNAAVRDSTPPRAASFVPLAAAAPSNARGYPTVHTAVRFVLVICAAAIACGLMRLLAHAWRLERRFAECSPAGPGRAANTLAGVLQRTRARRKVRLLISDDFSEPVACGALRGTIVLPRGMESSLSRRELEALLAHEAAHLVRGDTRWLLIGRLLCGCLWFQPLNFAARRAWRQAEEFLSDEWAVRHGVSALSLAEFLTQIAERRLDVYGVAAGLAAGGSPATLARRIERLVEERLQFDAWQRPRRRAAAALAAAVATAALTVWGPQGFAGDGANRDTPTPGASALQSEPPSLPPPTRNEDSPPDAPDLAEDLRQLDGELRRAEALFDRVPHDPEIGAVVNNLRQRAAALRQLISARTAAPPN